ncbi:class I adenylate-forming enzyme family protein [Neobacillus niacini]|uniref:class I adenylate-forming enzyme family protein n=1 Tax=Neobacillus niacini TaxID=86668 RepID=UPI0021CB09BA|nr:AMP-binding protein [Neobacillus niacini]MCM3766261.1 AMP-binding protein [Neobacillus niacini]
MKKETQILKVFNKAARIPHTRFAKNNLWGEIGMIVNFARLYKGVADQFKDQPALINLEKNRTFTYSQIHKLTNKISHLLTDFFKLEKGDNYAVLLQNDNLSLFTHGMLKNDITISLLNYRDGVDDHIYQLNYVKPKVIFTEKANLLNKDFYLSLKELEIQIVSFERVDLEDVYYFWVLVEEQRDDEVKAEYNADKDIIMYRFTGGTTGRGKCTQYTYRNIYGAAIQNFSQDDQIFSDKTKFLHVSPLSHATMAYFIPTLLKGGTNFTLNTPDLENICKAVQDHNLTGTFVVPTLLYRLLELGLEEKYDLSSLEAVVYGASPMSPTKLELLQSKFGNVFIQIYGASEAFPPAVVLPKKDHLVQSEKERKKLSSAGKPVLGVELIIVNAEGTELKPGEIGEIWVRSDCVIPGYYLAPEETHAAFTENGFFKSGDLGYLDEDGYVYIVDRKKDMIISGGFNVYAVEVENVINSHSAVSNSVVVGVPHEEWGEMVHAEVVLKEGQEISADELIAYCKTKLGSYKVPKTIHFVQELPTSSVGKVLRRHVKDKYWKNEGRKVH